MCARNVEGMSRARREISRLKCMSEIMTAQLSYFFWLYVTGFITLPRILCVTLTSESNRTHLPIFKYPAGKVSMILENLDRLWLVVAIWPVKKKKTYYTDLQANNKLSCNTGNSRLSEKEEEKKELLEYFLTVKFRHAECPQRLSPFKWQYSTVNTRFKFWFFTQFLITRRTVKI